MSFALPPCGPGVDVLDLIFRAFQNVTIVSDASVHSLTWSLLFSGLFGAFVGTGIKCGAESLMSFCFGLFFDPNGGNLRNMPLALSALGLLLASIGGIAYAGRPSDMEDDEEAGLLGNKENNKKLWHFAGESEGAKKVFSYVALSICSYCF